jgi:RNA polymerase sigma-70 factor (ECF subfamily)
LFQGSCLSGRITTDEAYAVARMSSGNDVEPEALMEAYQHGDRAAADRLIDSLSPALYRFLAVHAGDRRHAEDLLQEVWLRVHKARHTYRPGEPFLPWIFAIARHTRIDAYRRRRFERNEETFARVPEPGRMPVETRGPLPDIDVMLEILPESQREIISLLKISGLTLEEVARLTSSSVGSVKQKAHRAYEKLRAVLADYGPTTGRKDEAQ